MSIDEFGTRVTVADKVAEYAVTQVQLSTPMPKSVYDQAEVLAFDIAWSLLKYGEHDQELIKEVTFKALERVLTQIR